MGEIREDSLYEAPEQTGAGLGTFAVRPWGHLLPAGPQLPCI